MFGGPIYFLEQEDIRPVFRQILFSGSSQAEQQAFFFANDLFFLAMVFMGILRDYHAPGFAHTFKESIYNVRFRDIDSHKAFIPFYGERREAPQLSSRFPIRRRWRR